MMTRTENMSLTSEIRLVEQLLRDIPSGRTLEKMSLKKRLERLKSEAESIHPTTLPKRLRLTFRGTPVIGSEGVFADFAGEATSKLVDAFKAVAAGLKGDLKYMGPIPGDSSVRLVITGVAKGSFGFDFEAPRCDNDVNGHLFDGLNETEHAIDKVCHLLEVASSKNNDEALAEIVDEVHPRAVKRVKEFLDTLVSRGALCAMEFNNRSFRFTDKEQLDFGRQRLDDTNIHEFDQYFDGEIQGVLPKSRTFEFKIAGKDHVIRAKIGLEIENPDILNVNYLHHPSRVHLHTTQVGQGQPRYVMRQLPELGGARDGSAT